MGECATDLVVIPSIGDPRNTVTSLAMFQNAFAIEPPIPILVVYGTCPNPLEAMGEAGKRVQNWKPPPLADLADEVKQRFKDIAEHDRIPMFFFDQQAQYDVCEKLKIAADEKTMQLPEGITKEDYLRCVKGIFSATYSYGAQRNKAFMAAKNLSARFAFFFDDDTLLAPHVGDIIGRHRGLLERKKIYAVTGGYFGQRAFNVTIFRRVDEQQEFMGLLGYEIPDDQATQDLWGWRITEGVLGGNFCAKRDVYERICCPSMHRTPTTDDKLIGREIRRVFGREALVCKTGWPVVHVHSPERMQPTQVGPYLRSWAKTKAFWVVYDKTGTGEKIPSHESGGAEVEDAANEVVSGFGHELSKLAEIEHEQAGGRLAQTTRQAAAAMVKDADSIVNTVLLETEEFYKLRLCWPSIMSEMETMEIWTEGRNRFTPP